MTIAKKSSTHSGSLILQVSCIWNIYLKNDYAFHNAHKDEYRSIDLPYGQLVDNVGISNSAIDLEKFLEEIQNYGIGSIWYRI
jgi:hypothetical protein